MKNSANGFTLAEMLLVLAIFLLLISCSVPPAFRSLRKIEEKQFFQILKADIYLAQSEALLQQSEPVELRFKRDQLIIQRSDKPDLIEKYPNSMRIKKEENFKFLPQTGHINRFRTVKWQGETRNYQLKFQIGKGRFNIEEN
ncbi:competence type IV pilus minor pilin ComGD [Listeria valentina]|uniref:competence type IV pilus minor pilin ComGD n=1 Tax=Listeria valentina TaxID=2705293 RepID=UPI001AD91DD3|nr:competence type IV pilus minor pilin ComGD [Listeria valentina]